uniref:Uncharacterized protein n=1 Tax=Panagrolaimus sp. JU765 TaxID=591449 RepID=A0AC34QL47_9BILA
MTIFKFIRFLLLYIPRSDLYHGFVFRILGLSSFYLSANCCHFSPDFSFVCFSLPFSNKKINANILSKHQEYVPLKETKTTF